MLLFILKVSRDLICKGLSRLERWNRAEKFGLDPPRNVRDLIISYPNDKKYTEW